MGAIELERLYISSLEPVAKVHGQITRSYWSVENNVHWHLDVTFGEDQSKIRTGHGAENISLMRKSALNLLKADTSLKVGIENKRKKDGFISHLLMKSGINDGLNASLMR